MTDKQEAIDAAKTLKKFCLESNCLKCPCWEHLCDVWGSLDEVADEIVARLE